MAPKLEEIEELQEVRQQLVSLLREPYVEQVLAAASDKSYVDNES